jgi:protein subunit release factor A
VEKQMQAAESRVAEIEHRLSDPDLYKFPMEADILGREHARLKEAIALLYSEWEAATADLEEVLA